jgi:hypothetical protein
MSEFFAGGNQNHPESPLRILCLMPEVQVQSLQWVFNSHSLTDKKLEFSFCRLGEAAERAAEYDFFLLSLDLGQPVPHQHLKALWAKPGLAALVQPTPLQLLDVGRYPLLLPLSWDSSNFADLGTKLVQSLELLESFTKRSRFLEASLSWIELKVQTPSFVRWLNIPDRWPAPELYYIDKKRGLFSIGAANSGADLTLPEAGSQEFVYFQRQQDHWILRVLTQNVPIEFPPETNVVSPGLSFKIKDYEFEVLPDPELRGLHRRAKDLGLTQSDWQQARTSEATPSFSDVLKRFLLAGETGELVVRNGAQKAVLLIEEGILQQATTGSVVGEKALQRVFFWPQINWSWNPSQGIETMGQYLHLDYFKVKKLAQDWQLRWPKIHAAIPPAQLVMRISTNTFNQKAAWSFQDVQVVCSIAEFSQVVDVLNRCPLNDIDIFERLVHLRKEGLLEIGR